MRALASDTRMLPLHALALLILASTASALVTGLTLPGGFAVDTYYAGRVPHVRSLALSGATPQAGYGPIVYGADREDGKIFALVDTNADGYAEDLYVVLDGLNASSGVAWHEGSLYISELTSIWRLDAVDEWVLANPNVTYPRARATLLTDALPDTALYASRYLAVSPSGQLHVSIGTPCDSCFAEPYQKNSSTPVFQYAAIYKFNLTDFGSPMLVASGVRNSVGFDWHPETGELWFTNNGRTGMVSNWYSQIAPDDTLSRVPTEGGFFGFPYCYQGAAGGAADAPCARLAGVGAAIPDPYLNPDERNMSCSPGLDWLEAPPRRAFWQHLQSIVKYVVGVLAKDTKVTEGSGPLTQIYPAAQALGPHLISLGMTFYRRNASAAYAFPAAYDSTIFIAQRGSNVRDELAGYRVITVSLNDKAEPQGVLPFLSGLLVGDVGEAECPDVPRSNTSAVRGRPVDTLQLPDGSLLVSDDTGNKVYKIMYAGRVPAGGGQVSSGPVSSEDDRVSVFV